MRASRNIVSGCFCGGEIEPGTFHRKVALPDPRSGEHPPVPPVLGSCSTEQEAETTQRFDVDAYPIARV